MNKSIILLLLIMLFPIVANAHDFYVDGIYYTIINDSEVAVSYKGSTSFAYSNEYVGKVVIPESVTYEGKSYSVTSIGVQAFYECSGLTSVVIPNTIRSIGSSAFRYCYKLSKVNIPNSITSIVTTTFANCSILDSIDIPNSVTTIGYKAFQGCSNLKVINFPNSVYYIERLALDGTQWLNNQPGGIVYAGPVAYKYKYSSTNETNISIREGTKGIAEEAFYNCNFFTSVDIPSTVRIIGPSAFYQCAGISSIRIPNSVKTIDTYAFAFCSNLTFIELGDSIETIGGGAFSWCEHLLSIFIPKSVTSIFDNVFENCWRLESISVDPENLNYDSRNNCNAIIEKATNMLITGCKNTIIPNSVQIIGDRSFYNCDYLMSIRFPGSVKKIEYKAFDDCSYLNQIVIPNTVETISQGAFNNCIRVRELFICGEGPWQIGSITVPSSPTLYLQSTITSIKGISMNASTVYSYSQTPPECDENTFTNYSGTLHVPATSLAAYFTADYWNNFANIVGDAIEPNISISQDSVEVNLGDQISLTAIVTPANATPNSITWISTDTKIATVNNGKVIAVGVGECDIIAECLLQAICHVVVNDTTVMITLNQQEAMLLPNHMLTLTPIPNPIVPDLSVTSSDPSVAAARVVNNKVQVVGIKEGTTTITVGSADGTAIPATCLVTVYTEPGDMNCDGFVNISDVTSLIDYLLSGDDSQISTKNADVNGDESINISDVTTLIDILLSGN